MDTSFRHIDEVYGSFDNYVVDGLELSGGTVDLLRERMLR
ncbi:tyrosine-protein phosphatase [Nocardiopsis tropica]|nr:tyrosine-protein phosphatase [Nocardiopsis tropica]